jgi:hypothetical protein
MVAALIDTALPDDRWPDDRFSDTGWSDHGWSDHEWSDHEWSEGPSFGDVVPERNAVETTGDSGSVGGSPPQLAARCRPARPPSVPSAAVIHRRRVVAGGGAAMILLGLFVGLQALFGRPGGGPLASVGSPAAVQPAVARIWLVHPGDTLWSIALASGASGDIRPLVARMSAEVGGRPLQPGERILVP